MWTDKASKRQEVSAHRARKHQLYKQNALNSEGQKPPLCVGLAKGILNERVTVCGESKY